MGIERHSQELLYRILEFLRSCLIQNDGSDEVKMTPWKSDSLIVALRWLAGHA